MAVTGHVSNITIKDEWTGQGQAPPEYALYHDLALFYNINDTLAYALWDHWLVNEQGEWYDYGMDHAREFRFDGPTQRYMVRDINDLGNGWEITDTLWTDYDGAAPYNDFTVTVDGQGQPTAAEQTRYLEGFGIPAQQTVATGETRYLHGDLIRSTMLIRDELGSDQPTLAYTAFGEPVTPDGQGGWRVGYPPGDPGTRYQYAGGWGYETGGSAQDPGGPSANSNMLALYGANPALPPIALQHVGARWYDPGLGRFIQRDRIGLLGGLNVYAYCGARPLGRIDPDGLLSWSPWGWRDPLTGRFAKPPLLYRKVPWPSWMWMLTCYNYEVEAFHLGYDIAGEPWPGDPGDQSWDLIKLLREWYEREEVNRKQRLSRPDVFPPGPSRPYDGPFCFVGGTAVAVPGAHMPIDALEVGAKVLCSAPACAEQTQGQVIGVRSGLARELVVIELEHEVIACTAEHPFWVVHRGWMKARQLAASDCLVNSRLEAVEICTIQVVRLSEPAEVYSITTSDAHTYFVGTSEVLVHNKMP